MPRNQKLLVVLDRSDDGAPAAVARDLAPVSKAEIVALQAAEFVPACAARAAP